MRPSRGVVCRTLRASSPRRAETPAGPPPEVLSTAMRTVGELTPLHWVIYMLQSPWLGFAWDTSASLIVAGVTVVSAGLAAKFFRWE